MGSSVCEAGCANSVWVPFLVEHGANVSGIDYSALGIERLQRVLTHRGLHAELILGDLFDSEAMPRGRYDFLFSLGLVEHFTDGIGVVRALADLLKPGGTLLTVVPNLLGVWGAIQKRLNERCSTCISATVRRASMPCIAMRVWMLCKRLITLVDLDRL